MQHGSGRAGGSPHGSRGGEPGPEEGPAIQVTDRRRFSPDGEERADAADAPSGPATSLPPDSAGGDPSSRLDEVTRAYAALVDDNRSFRQRMEREKDRVVAAERSKVAQALLEAYDELEMAWNASRRSPEEEDPALHDLREGVRLTLQGIAARVAALGAERLEVRGKPYDPRTAEAVDLVAVTDPAQDGRVTEEIRPGWRNRGPNPAPGPGPRGAAWPGRDADGACSGIVALGAAVFTSASNPSQQPERT